MRPSDTKFKSYVAYTDETEEEYSEQVCPDCIATFFTETPENVKFVSISRVEE